MTAQRPDSNQQLGMARICITCHDTAVPRPWKPGWTPRPDAGGWTCPACSRKMSA